MPRIQVRRTKIVATLGPAWDQPAQMTALLDAGVNVVRINASHGTAAIRARWIAQLKDLIASRRDSVAILLDLQGPRIRIGTLAQPLRLEPGRTVTFAPEVEAAGDEIPTTYDALATDVRVGARILLDDGLLSLEVSSVRDDRVDAVVHYGGELKSHKGMNLPGIEVSAPALTEKDLEDVAEAVAVGVDYVALSFVRRSEDMEQLRALVPRSTKLVAKIEKDTALRNLCGILDASDAIMVARGDLGVELPFERGAAGAEADHPRGEPARQAGHHGHADAGVDGARAAAHPGRGVGCGQCDPRRDRRRHALGGDGDRAVTRSRRCGRWIASPARWRGSARRGASPSTPRSGVGRRTG